MNLHTKYVCYFLFRLNRRLDAHALAIATIEPEFDAILIGNTQIILPLPLLSEHDIFY